VPRAPTAPASPTSRRHAGQASNTAAHSSSSGLTAKGSRSKASETYCAKSKRYSPTTGSPSTRSAPYEPSVFTLNAADYGPRRPAVKEMPDWLTVDVVGAKIRRIRRGGYRIRFDCGDRGKSPCP
jgi:hypothetical protein